MKISNAAMFIKPKTAEEVASIVTSGVATGSLVSELGSQRCIEIKFKI